MVEIITKLNRVNFLSILLVFLLTSFIRTWAVDKNALVSFDNNKGSFPLTSSGRSASLYASSDEFPGVIRAINDLKADIGRVSNTEPKLFVNELPTGTEVVYIGTLGRNPVIDKLVEDKRIDVSEIAGKWEAFLIQVVDNPMPGVAKALIIAGNDKRGTIYGIYTVSEKIGVSPWYWWADVPVIRHDNIFIITGKYVQSGPAVKYRGIFINDEAPALSGWTKEKFGGFNHKLYEKVFELILRLKGNYLWPAMWGNAFYDDDTLSPVLADEYGVVIGTSHHEPLLRAHDEWRRYGKGKWNYQVNDSVLRQFWRKGITRMGTKESIITVGMRGDGDEPMSEESNIALLERIVSDQRKIISDVTGKKASDFPQLWALYKEVQEYYDKGMRVPDDITLLLCDDNWGDIRKLPNLNEPKRKGGYGIYYHFDYVGGPRNYKWLNTNQIQKVWEQMNLAFEYGARQIWIVNVGDIKPMEFPISFFLDYAWSPESWKADNLSEYTQLWAKQQFGGEHSKEIGDILTTYTKYNSRRKPELLSPETYSLIHFKEAETVVADYNKLAKKADSISNLLPDQYKDAFFQLVLHPVKACSNVNDLYVTTGKNWMYARQGRAGTNALAERIKTLFEKDAEYSLYYNKTLAGGKWSHMMDQTHIGYTYWQQPEKDKMPKDTTISLLSEADMGIAIEGSEKYWPVEKTLPSLPVLDNMNKTQSYFEIFNRGKTPFDYFVTCDAGWIKLNPDKGKINEEQRISIAVDWQKAPKGISNAQITINGPNSNSAAIQMKINNLSNNNKGFVESNGYISIEAQHYKIAIDSLPVQWICIPDLGRTLSGITAFPVTSKSIAPSKNSPHLEFAVYFTDTGEVKVNAYISPTLNFNATAGLRYAVSIDDEIPQIINIHTDKSNKTWEKWVADNINIQTSIHKLASSGTHILKFWMVDPGIVLQKLVIVRGEEKRCYLGPPESNQIK